MSDEDDKVYKGEVMPPMANRPAEITKLFVPRTGALISPYLKAKAITRVLNAYNDGLAALERLHSTNARLHDAMMENKRSVARLGDADEILADDREKWLAERARQKHERELDQRRRDQELADFDMNYSRLASKETMQHEVEMLQLEVQKIGLTAEKAELEFAKGVIDGEKRDATIERSLQSAPTETDFQVWRDTAYQAVVEECGGEENLTDAQREIFAGLDKSMATEFSERTEKQRDFPDD